MKNSKPKNKNNVLAIRVGLMIGILIILVASVVLYKMTPRDTRSKAQFMLHKGKENLLHYGQAAVTANAQQTQTADIGTKSRPLQLSINADRTIRTINPMIYGSNFSPKVEYQMYITEFGKEMGITNYRYPGGGSPGYRWQLGTFDFSDRFDTAPYAKIKNVIEYCKQVGAKLVIQVNIESGTPQEAAEWVKYMNQEGGMHVEYWELGNEIYGNWDKAHMPGDEYAEVIKTYSTLMKQVDPTIKIGANWGGPRYQNFDEAIMKDAADHIDFVSMHWYPDHTNPKKPYKGRNHPMAEEIMANALAVEGMVKRFEQLVEKYAPHRSGTIEFTIMEWDGSWDAAASDLKYEYKGMMWSLANALFYADTLGQFALHGVTVANHYTFQEVSFGMIRGWDKEAGWGGSPWDQKTIRPKALAFQMVANHFGDTLIESTLSGSPFFYKEPDWRPDSYAGKAPYVVSYVSKSSTEPYLSIVLINRHEDKDFKTNIVIQNAALESEGDVLILTGPSLEAQNDGSTGVVSLKKYRLIDIENNFSYNIPARSVSLIKIPTTDLMD